MALFKPCLDQLMDNPMPKKKRFVRHYTGDDVSSDIATIIETLALSASRASMLVH
jgi:hypothetical protein